MLIITINNVGLFLNNNHNMILQWNEWGQFFLCCASKDEFEFNDLIKAFTLFLCVYYLSYKFFL